MENLPTKADLLHGELVDITANHKNVETNSLKIAKSLDVQHSDVTRNIKRLIKSGAISQRNIAVSDYLSERGKSYQYYHLKEVEALQVIMSLSGSKAEQLHKELAQAFVSVKKENAEWRSGRLIATNTTKLANDQLELLKQDLFRINPASNKAVHLYSNTQKAINKAVTGIYGALNRETLHTHQLNDIGRLEWRLSETIERLRNESINPERIYYDVMTMLKEKTPQATKLEGAFHNAT